MATAEELVGQQLSETEAVRVYAVHDTDDIGVAKTAVEAAAPATFNALLREPPQIEERNDKGIFYATVSYRSAPKKQPEAGDDPKYNFSMGSTPWRRYFSIATIADYPSGASKDWDNAIGARRSGSDIDIEGVDVSEPTYSWDETHYYADGSIDDTFISNIFSLAWHVNNDTFKLRKGGTATFAIGEVLFKGASGQRMANGDWAITYHFDARPNKASFDIGTITAIAKEGWEYVWVEFENKELSAPVKGTVKVPAYAHVEQVYDTAAFADLGIR